MDRWHDSVLTSRLEEALLHGCAHISYPELYRWYGVKKIAAGTYRDLTHRWKELDKEITNGGAGELMQVEGKGGIFIFGSAKARKVDPD